MNKTPRIIVKNNKLKPILAGHPWVFPRAIVSGEKQLKAGDFVEIASEDLTSLGFGFYNPNSLYRVRIIIHAFEAYKFKGIEALLEHRFSSAFQLRTVLGLPNEDTNAYRLFNGAADGLDGLTIDRYNKVTVVQSSAYWSEEHREMILVALKKHLVEDTILWRSQDNYLKLEGWFGSLFQEVHPSIMIKENGINYEIDLTQGQKSGFYLDQRENRMMFRNLAKNKRVLDICCYSGAFALNAMRGGASFVRGLDSSGGAITLAEKNAALNHVTENIIFEKHDIKTYLGQHEEMYDLIILDPPKLSPRHGDIKSASRFYFKLNELAMKRLNAGGLFFTCSCSSAMTSEYLQEIVQTGAAKLGRRVSLLSQSQAASDHPTSPVFPEGDYFSGLLFYVE